jgi:flagella basal body P-ring formation protein FlgA
VKHIRMMLSMLIAGACGVAAARADTIRLKSAAMVEENAAITLSQVAELEGPKAEMLGDLVIAKTYADLSNNAWAMLDIEDVRELLQRRDDVAWASLELQGSSVTIRPNRLVTPATTPRQPAATPKKVESVQGGDAGTETVRGQVIAHIADELHVTVDDLRLTFETSDTRLLDTTLGNRTAVVQVLGAGAKVPVAVRVLEGERTVIGGTIRVGTLVRTPVAVAHRVIGRNEIVEEGHFAVEDRWIAPGMDYAAPSQLVGSSVRQRITAGAIVKESDLEAPEVVSKGDIVAVDCVAGSVVVTQRARALEGGKKGEVIELESLSPKQELVETARGGKSKTKNGPKSKFRARIDGPGRAIAVAAGTDAPASAVTGTAVPEEKIVYDVPMAAADPTELAAAPDVGKPPARKKQLKFFPIKDGR